ncbi:MAG: hypothetical protein IT379_37935 [Deltaproteobacteria bacterium]|nr:hypothetical protein [Deltaproteobacteria bacterium]
MADSQRFQVAVAERCENAVACFLRGVPEKLSRVVDANVDQAALDRDEGAWNEAREMNQDTAAEPLVLERYRCFSQPAGRVAINLFVGRSHAPVERHG